MMAVEVAGERYLTEERSVETYVDLMIIPYHLVPLILGQVHSHHIAVALDP